MTLRDAALDALAVLLPVACAGCGELDRSICATCRAALTPQIMVAQLDSSASRSPPVIAGLPYADTARRVILAFKDADRPALARVLAPALASAARELARRLGEQGAREAVLCAIPSGREARRRRGYVPVHRLARAAGLRTVSLLDMRRGHEQKSLDAAGRERNARERIRVVAPVCGRRVVLVDDVVTTGATLRAAARALETAGAEVIGAVALAARPWRGEPAPAPTQSPRAELDRPTALPGNSRDFGR